jgi:hypothetical protein
MGCSSGKYVWLGGIEPAPVEFKGARRDGVFGPECGGSRRAGEWPSFRESAPARFVIERAEAEPSGIRVPFPLPLALGSAARMRSLTSSG